MQNHLELSDEEFERQFEACDLDPILFNHEAHLRLAWIHIDKYGIDIALQNIEAQLKDFVAHVGAASKYHQTLTIAAIKAVDHFKQKSQSNTFKTFIAEFPRLNTHFKELINSHYTYDIFSSEAARKEFIAPDLLPFSVGN